MDDHRAARGAHRARQTRFAVVRRYVDQMRGCTSTRCRR